MLAVKDVNISRSYHEQTLTNACNFLNLNESGYPATVISVKARIQAPFQGFPRIKGIIQG